MKDKDNKTWEEIREAWSAMTGKQVGASTLPVRYQRLKANFMAFTAEDVSITTLVWNEEQDILFRRQS